MTDELIGTRLGQYHLIELIAHGGMATVYKARQPSLDRFVAVKVMHHTRDPQFAARFKREARAIAQLQHPNILPIYDYGEQDGLLFLVMQYVENGITLTHRMGAPLPPLAALRLMRGVLAGLEYAHSRGVIHRDIKPDNVLLPSAEWPMLADFGIAKLIHETGQQLTMPGILVGTAAYMAPEQALAQAVDARTDLYATGVLLYELLTGRVPFDGDTLTVLVTRHVYEPPPPPTRYNPSLPPALEQAVLRALAKKPEERYQTAAEMAAALEEIAVQLQRGDKRGQVTAFYQAGVLAFAEGRWDQAVEQLSQLVALDPEYEDGADLLAAAREARERARAEARAQIERVRQRRSTAAQPQAGTPQPPPPAATGETTRMPPAATGETRLIERGREQQGAAAEPLAAMGETSALAPPPASGETAGPEAPATGKTSSLEAPATSEASQPTSPAAGEAGRARSAATGETIRVPSPLGPAINWPADVQAGRPGPGPVEAPPAGIDVAPAPNEPQGLVSAVDSIPPTSEARMGVGGVQRAPAEDSESRPVLRRTPIILGASMVLLLIVGALVMLVRLPGVSSSPPTAAPTMAPTPVPTAAPTPVPTAAPALEPLPAPAGALVFEDDFGAGPEKSGLVASWAAPELTLSVASGAYSMQLAQPVDTRWMLLPRVAAGDFSLQIDLADTSVDRSGSAAAGVVFRARDGRNFYALLIDARTGRYSIRKQEGGSWSELIPWKPAAQIRQGSEVNQLRLDAQGESFTIYLNGALIDRFRDGAFASGMVGTIVDSNGAAQPQLQFDNLKLWSSDPPPPPSNLPATRQNAIGIDMVLIPGGEFIMGSNDDPNALPHMVMLPDFYIDRKEVTNIIYVVCADAQGCALPAPVDSATRKPYFGAQEFNTYPVINVTWEQARYYCEAQQKRLPTEAEWEKAASWNATTRAKSIWPWGDQFTAGRLNSAEANQGDTVMVGTYAAEQNGTFDLAGNAAEWTSTLNRPYPYDGDDGREDLQTTDDRIVRGGSWAQPQEASTGHARRPHPPAAASNQIGFRCVAGP